MMTHVENTIPIVKSNLKRLCDYRDAYILVIVYIHIYTCEKQKNPEVYGNITEIDQLLL